MTTGLLPQQDDRSDAADLRHRIAKLEKINAALMAHVERATDQHEGAYSLFQTAIMLEGRVRARTEELTGLMHSLERSNEALKVTKDEAERANRSKTKFLAAASHDLLQPLNAARLSSSALVDLDLSYEARELARQIERGLQTIEDTIKTLLDISKLDAGVVHPVKKPIRIQNVVQQITDGFRPLAEKKRVRLIVRCADAAVESDVALLQRVIQNLVSNALRYTNEGGVLVAARVREGACKVDVIDTGRGICEAERDLVFEEFYRGKDVGPHDSGLGLGLSIVRRMMLALGHRLEVWSRVGHGSRFRLTLPLASGPVEDLSAVEAGSPALLDARIVVIENDAATLTVLTRLLQSWCLSVAAFTDVSAWRSRAELLGPPDILIVDYHLDNGCIGLDAAAEIRARVGKDLPVVVATADHSVEVEQKVIAARCELMRKPVKPARLRSLLTFLLGVSQKA